MRICVTGGAGFLGSHIVDSLVERGHKVLSLDDISGGFWRNINPKCEFLELDLRDKLDAEVAVQVFKPEILVHCAANAREGASFFDPINICQRNLMAYINILEPCIKYGVKRVVMTSSMAVYGNQIPPFLEIMAYKPADPYGANKVAMEETTKQLADLYKFSYVIIRPHNVFGTKQCVPKGTLLPTNRGILKIEDILPRDYIYNREGNKKQVKYTMNLGIGEIIRIKLDDGTYSEGGKENHKILIVKENGDIDWEYMKNLKVGNWIIKISKNFLENEKENIVDIRMGELLGLLVGDGCYCRKSRMFISAKSTIERLNYVFELIKELLPDCKPRISEGSIVWDNIKRREWFKNTIGLGFHKAIDKEIPSFILTGNMNIKKGFIRGLFSADGHVTKQEDANRHHTIHIGLTSISKSLIFQMQFLLSMFNIKSRIYFERKREKQETQKYYNQSYKIIISDIESARVFINNIGFTYEDKQKKAKELLNLSEIKYKRGKDGDIIPYFYNIIKKILKEEKWDLQAKRCLVNAGQKGLYSHRRLCESVLRELEKNKLNNNGEYKIAKNLLNKNYRFHKIINIEEDKMWLHDLEVDGKEYITNMIVNHNSIKDKFRNVVGIFMNRIMRDEPIYIYGDGNNKRAFSYIKDSLPCYIQCIEDDNIVNETYNIGGINPITINYLAELVIAAFGKKDYPIIHLPERHGEVKNAWSTYQKSVDQLGYKERYTLNEAILEMKDWAVELGAQEWTDETLPLEHEKLPETWRKRKEDR